MTFLILVPDTSQSINAGILEEVAGDLPITWFNTSDPGLGGAICMSPLAKVARLGEGTRHDSIFVGRVRLDRREELRAQLSEQLPEDAGQTADAELCLHAYARWGSRFVEHIHGDFAFAIFDIVTRKLICVRDRFGIRLLAWMRGPHGFWAGGSMRELLEVPASGARELDTVWISDFLRKGVCDDPTRSVYTAVRRLAPSHILILHKGNVVQEKYWELSVKAPLRLASAAAYEEAFHSHLDAAIRDRLPSDRLGILMSGGMDSSTLAAKASKLGGTGLQVAVRTWLVGGDVDPESEASAEVAEFLRLERTVVDADRLRMDPRWFHKETTTPEPSLEAINPLERLADTQAMRSQAACWFFGEGPDNALTFEWRMQFGWMVRRRQWGRLPATLAAYLTTKSIADWKTTFGSSIWHDRNNQEQTSPQPSWVRHAGSINHGGRLTEWRPRAHQSLSSSLWQYMFETLDADGERVGIEFRHPYLDLRILEFFLATPPIPWARHKLLIRRAMKGYLPPETLGRRKTALYKDDLAELLRRNLPPKPQPGDAVEEFVDLAALPDDWAAHPDIHALTRVAILQHWLSTRHA
jgi:asparagine synthase (glutamine-hydrolysing)